MAQPRPPNPEPPSVVYAYAKKITKDDINEIAVFTEAGVNRNMVYAETLDGKHHSVFMPKKILQTHFKKEAGHTTEERGTALGKRRKGNRKNKTMRKKSRRHGRKSRKHHRRRH